MAVAWLVCVCSTALLAAWQPTSCVASLAALQAGSASGTTGVAVDVPQPLSVRHGGMMRSPGRSLPTPSDPGHMGMTSAFSNAANITAAQVQSWL